jgi:hypothetical protein
MVEPFATSSITFTGPAAVLTVRTARDRRPPSWIVSELSTATAGPGAGSAARAGTGAGVAGGAGVVAGFAEAEAEGEGAGFTLGVGAGLGAGVAVGLGVEVAAGEGLVEGAGAASAGCVVSPHATIIAAHPAIDERRINPSPSLVAAAPRRGRTTAPRMLPPRNHGLTASVGYAPGTAVGTRGAVVQRDRGS